MRSLAVVPGVVLVAVSLISATGCTGDPDREPTSADRASEDASDATPTSPSASPTRSGGSPAPEPGTVPPPWLGTRVLPTTQAGFGEVRPTPMALRNRRFTLSDQVSPLPGAGFASRVVSPAPREVIARSTWRAGCPVGPADLAWLRLAFWGFDDRRHTGELLVHRAVADDLVSVFGRLYRAPFPLEEMSITTQGELDAPPTGDGNATTAFVCRPTTGGTSYSQHAYGLAIDVNSFQNPYVKGPVVLPELASAYLDRTWTRPGMIGADGVVVRAFAAVGWEWGGAWQSLKDYQHFSLTGR